MLLQQPEGCPAQHSQVQGADSGQHPVACHRYGDACRGAFVFAEFPHGFH